MGGTVVFTLIIMAAAISTAWANRSNESKCGDLEAGILGTDGDDTLTGTEGNDVILGLGGDDVIRGLGGDDFICGGEGDDSLFGDGGTGGGDDTIISESGRDVVAGGRGSDTLSFSRARMGVSVDLNTGTVVSDGWGSAETTQGVENLTGSDFRDVLSGDAAANAISGGKGDDSLSGGTGEDALDGGGSGDVIDSADGGRDFVDGGSGAIDHDACIFDAIDIVTDCP